jgi:hypothetical protein
VRDLERNQVNAILHSIIRGHVEYRPGVLEAIVRQALLESDTFGAWFGAQVQARAQDLLPHAERDAEIVRLEHEIDALTAELEDRELRRQEQDLRKRRASLRERILG